MKYNSVPKFSTCAVEVSFFQSNRSRYYETIHGLSLRNSCLFYEQWLACYSPGLKVSLYFRAQLV